MRLRQGDFPEDKLGQLEKNDIRTNGMSVHPRYGTWLLFDSATPGVVEDDEDGKVEESALPGMSRVVVHMRGRQFLSEDTRAQKVVARENSTQNTDKD